MSGFKSLIRTGAAAQARGDVLILHSAGHRHVEERRFNSSKAASTARGELLRALRLALAGGEINSNSDYNSAVSAWLEGAAGR